MVHVLSCPTERTHVRSMCQTAPAQGRARDHHGARVVVADAPTAPVRADVCTTATAAAADNVVTGQPASQPASHPARACAACAPV